MDRTMDYMNMMVLDLIKARDELIAHEQYFTAFYCQMAILSQLSDEDDESIFDENLELCTDIFYKMAALVDMEVDEDIFLAMISDIWGIDDEDEPDMDIYGNSEKFHDLISLHFYIVCSVYSKDQPEISRKYIDTILAVYRKRFGSSSEIYLKLYIFIIGEFMSQCQPDWAIDDFYREESNFKERLKNDPYLYVVMLRLAEYLSSFDDERTLDMIITVDNNLHILNPEPEIYISIKYCVCRGYFFNGDLTHAEEEYRKLISELPTTHSLYAKICSDLSAVYSSYNLEQADMWIQKGLESCISTNNTDSEEYIELLRNSAGSEYSKGNKNECIVKIQKALKIAEKTCGRTSHLYVTCLSLAMVYIDDYSVKHHIAHDMTNIARQLTDPYDKAYIYSMLSMYGFNKHGNFTLDASELEDIAARAYAACKKRNVTILEAINALCYLRTQIAQPSKYFVSEDEINEIILSLDAFFAANDCASEIVNYFTILKADYAAFRKDTDIPQNLIDFDGYSDNYHEENILMEQFNTCVSKIRKKDYEGAIVSIIDLCRTMIDKRTYFVGLVNLLSLSSFLFQLILRDIDKYGMYMHDAYEISATVKYLSAKYHMNFMDNENNVELLNSISELESIMLHTMTGEDDSKISEQIDECFYNLDFSYDMDSVEIPALSDIRIPKNSVVIDIFNSFKIDDSQDTDIIDAHDLLEQADIVCPMFLLKNSGGDGDADICYIQQIDMYEYCLLWDDMCDDESEVSPHILYKYFFDKVAPHLNGVKTIYIIGDECFLRFPIDFLTDDDGQMLIDRYNIVYAQTVFDIREDFKVSTERPLVIGNPVYELRSEEDTRSVNLKYSKIECLAIANMMNTAAYMDEDASKSVLLNNLKSTLIHISAHGDFMDIDFLKYITPSIASFILLSPDDQSAAKNPLSGMLTAEELSHMDLSTVDMINFASCNSAQSDIGVNGLRWAALYAGAKSTISSLCEIDDKDAAVFMIIFYRELKKNTLFKAFSNAKRIMKNLTMEKINHDPILQCFFTDTPYKSAAYKPYDGMDAWGTFVCCV